MIRARALLLVGLTGLLGSGGCGGEEGLAAGAGGEEVRPQRIVSLIPAATGILVALGAEPSLVGVGGGDPSPAARGVESVGSILTPTWERVVALEPTLLVLWDAVDATPVRQALPDTVVVLRETLETLGDLERVTLHLGALLGRSDRAEALVGDCVRVRRLFHRVPVGGVGPPPPGWSPSTPSWWRDRPVGRRRSWPPPGHVLSREMSPCPGPPSRLNRLWRSLRSCW